MNRPYLKAVAERELLFNSLDPGFRLKKLAGLPDSSFNRAEIAKILELVHGKLYEIVTRLSRYCHLNFNNGKKIEGTMTLGITITHHSASRIMLSYSLCQESCYYYYAECHYGECQMS